MITEEQREFYRVSIHRAAHFENMKPHNPSTEDWCIAEDLAKGDYLMMDPACKVIEKCTKERTMGMRYWKKDQTRHWSWILMR